VRTRSWKFSMATSMHLPGGRKWRLLYRESRAVKAAGSIRRTRAWLASRRVSLRRRGAAQRDQDRREPARPAPRRWGLPLVPAPDDARGCAHRAHQRDRVGHRSTPGRRGRSRSRRSRHTSSPAIRRSRSTLEAACTSPTSPITKDRGQRVHGAERGRGALRRGQHAVGTRTPSAGESRARVQAPGATPAGRPARARSARASRSATSLWAR
jgi:hypothetical protein